MFESTFFPSNYSNQISRIMTSPFRENFVSGGDAGDGGCDFEEHLKCSALGPRKKKPGWLGYIWVI